MSQKSNNCFVKRTERYGPRAANGAGGGRGRQPRQLPDRAPGRRRAPRRHLHNAGPAVNQGRQSLQPVRLHSGAGFPARLSFSGTRPPAPAAGTGGFLKRPLLSAAEPPRRAGTAAKGQPGGPQRRRHGFYRQVGPQPCPPPGARRRRGTAGPDGGAAGGKGDGQPWRVSRVGYSVRIAGFS